MTQPTRDPHNATPPAPADEHHRRTFWICLAIGWGAIAVGVFGILDHPSDADPVRVFRLLVGLNITNDAVVVPVFLLAGFLLRRWAPRWLLAPAQAWLIVSGVVTLYAYPLVGHFGGAAGNPSELPHNYAHNLLVVVGLITLVCTALAVAAWRRDRPARS